MRGETRSLSLSFKGSSSLQLFPQESLRFEHRVPVQLRGNRRVVRFRMIDDTANL